MENNYVELKYDSCLVTGGAGFIGSHICEEALAQGKRVVCVDNMVGGKRDNIEPFKNNPNFTFVMADITNSDTLERCFEGIDVVFHNAASKCTVCRDNPKLDLLVNSWGSWNVFEACRKAGVKKVIHASTGSVYGEAKYFPQDEEHPYAPRSFYGVSKMAGENYLAAFKEYYPDFRYSVIRYFHVYGPRQESADWGGVIPIFIRRAYEGLPLIIYGDGSQQRSFTYVKDDVSANFVLANTGISDGESYNSASGIKVTILELARMVLKLMKRDDLEVQFKDWRAGDIKIFDVNNTKIKELGVSFEINFEKGLQAAIDWYVSYFDRIKHS
ncbi:MAG: SDR family NAD(P)-dependent oxidoreductase [Nitrospirota bacterium]